MDPDLFGSTPPPVDRLGVVSVAPGDVLLVRATRSLSMAEIRAIGDQVRAALGYPELKLIVTDPSYELEFVRPTEGRRRGG